MTAFDPAAILLAALITTSVVELLKDLTPLRHAFNRWAVQRWLWRGLDVQIARWPQFTAITQGRWLEKTDLRFPTKPNSPASSGGTWVDVEERVVALAACGRRDALYRPEIAQIAGQLNLLAEQLMDFPARSPIALRALAGVPERPDAEREGHPDADLRRLEELQDGFRAELSRLEAAAVDPTGEKASAASRFEAAGKLIDVRTRVTALVQGRLNELQIAGRTSWRIALLVLAVVIGIGVVALAGGRMWVHGGFAGLLAPIGHELLNAVKRVGRG